MASALPLSALMTKPQWMTLTISLKCSNVRKAQQKSPKTIPLSKVKPRLP